MVFLSVNIFRIGLLVKKKLPLIVAVSASLQAVLQLVLEILGLFNPLRNLNSIQWEQSGFT